MSETPPTIAYALESELSLRGGVNVLVETLIENLPPEYRVVLLSTDQAGSDPRRLHPRVTAHVPWTLKPTSRDQALRVARKLQALGVQLVHFHGGVFGFGMRFFGHCPIRPLHSLGIRTVWTNHTWVSVLDGFCGPQKPLLVKLGFLPWAWLSRARELQALDMLVAVSHLTWKKERFWYWPARKKARVIYHSRSREATPAPNTPRDKMILSVGHFAWRKGQLVLLRAFERIAAQFPEWRLVIIGPPSDLQYAREVQKEAERSRVAGRIDLLGERPDALEFTRKAGVFVQPSVWEGLPIALQEALFMATPCVATDCQGNDELVQHERNGLMVPVNDEAALAKALARMIEDDSLRKKLGAAARESVLSKGMTIEAMSRNHLELYRSLLES